MGLLVALVPLCIALSAWLASLSGFDRAVSDAFYDASLVRFPAHDSFWLELLGHRIAKAAIWIVAIGMLGAAIVPARTWLSAEQRHALVNLWAAAIDWWAAALVFTSLLSRKRR